jgi:prepilin-type N-terminal cleavage/methylation domain-containing protein
VTNANAYSHMRFNTNAASIGVRGFTLVEMLISLVLSAIIFLSAYEVISNLIQYQIRYGVKSEIQMDRLLLRSMIGQILGKGIYQGDMYFKIKKDPFFQGKSNSIQIISRAYSDHFDVPGYRVYKLYLAEKKLTVAYSRYDKESLSRGAVIQSSGIQVEEMSFEYFFNGKWVEEWQDAKSVPKLIKVRITLPNKSTFAWVNQTGQA